VLESHPEGAPNHEKRPEVNKKGGKNVEELSQALLTIFRALGRGWGGGVGVGVFGLGVVGVG